MAANGTPAQTITGGRALLYLPNGQGTTTLVGVFDTVNYTRGLGTEEIHTLGAYGPREIAITSSNAVTINCSGFRLLNQTSESVADYPTFVELSNGYSPGVIKVVDRQTGTTMLVAINCTPTSENGSHSARATSKLSISYIGTAIYDESTTDANGNPTDQELNIPSWP